MDDRIRMHDYSKEQLLLLIEDYVTINFQGMKYQTREAILNMICDAVNYYDIGKDLNWESIIAIRDMLMRLFLCTTIKPPHQPQHL